MLTDEQKSALEAALDNQGKLHASNGQFSDGKGNVIAFNDVATLLEQGYLYESKTSQAGEPLQVKAHTEKVQELVYKEIKETANQAGQQNAELQSGDNEQQKTQPVAGERDGQGSQQQKPKPREEVKQQMAEEGKSTLAKLTDHYSNEDIDIIGKTIAKDCNRSELGLFLKKAASLGLNPLNGECWCYKDHRGNLIMFAGRDGRLRKAQEHPDWGGMRSAEVRENDHFWANEATGEVEHQVDIRKDRGAIVGAWAKVWRKGCEPSLRVVQIEEWDRGMGSGSKKKNAWDTNKPAMIVKVPQSQSLHEAFPISGVQMPEAWTTDDQGYAVPVGNNPAQQQGSRHAATLDQNGGADE